MTIQQEKRVYGRRQGRPLNTSRQAVLKELLPVLSIAQESLKEDGSLDPQSLFNFTPQETWLEIGFGAGEHLSALMRRHPENAYLGAEPYINGMAAFLKDIAPLLSSSCGSTAGSHDKQEDPAIKSQDDINVKVIMDDAMMLAHSLQAESLDGIYILNPDPWHKKRHHKRRIVNPQNLDTFARILKPGAPLIMSTDVPDLADWMITHAARHSALTWTAQSAHDWRIPPKDWIHTAYESKKAKGADKMCYLFFQRK